MTLTLAVNSDNDLYLDKQGNIALVSGIDAVLQCCEHAAKTLLGEMILNVDQGIPYFETVWAGVPQVAQFDSALRLAFLAVDGVTEVIELNTSQLDNQLNYTATIRTIYGEGIASGSV